MCHLRLKLQSPLSSSSTIRYRLAGSRYNNHLKRAKTAMSNQRSARSAHQLVTNSTNN